MTAREALRMAVVGTRGQAARVAVPTIMASSGARLVGVLGSSVERTQQVAAQLEVRADPSVEALAGSKEVDAVWVTAPNHLHALMAAALLPAGVHVLLEKPMAIDEQDAAALAEVHRSSSATLRVACQHRFRTAHQRLREQVRREDLGEVRRLRVHRYWKFPYSARPSTQRRLAKRARDQRRVVHQRHRLPLDRPGALAHRQLGR